jgi:putative nucleotidyltransferase with HDIG domain
MGDDAPSFALRARMDAGDFAAYPFSLLEKLPKTEQSPVHHPEGNVWNHTLLVVDEAAKRKNKSSDSRVFMWAALLHDIGKPPTTKKHKGHITAYDHDKVGAGLARKFLESVTDDSHFIDKVAHLVRYHMQILYVVNDLPYRDISGMKKCADVREVALLGLCDRLGRVGAQREDEEKQVRMFLNICDE